MCDVDKALPGTSTRPQMPIRHGPPRQQFDELLAARGAERGKVEGSDAAEGAAGSSFSSFSRPCIQPTAVRSTADRARSSSSPEEGAGVGRAAATVGDEHEDADDDEDADEDEDEDEDEDAAPCTIHGLRFFGASPAVTLEDDGFTARVSGEAGFAKIGRWFHPSEAAQVTVLRKAGAQGFAAVPYIGLCRRSFDEDKDGSGSKDDDSVDWMFRYEVGFDSDPSFDGTIFGAVKRSADGKAAANAATPDEEDEEECGLASLTYADKEADTALWRKATLMLDGGEFTMQLDDGDRLPIENSLNGRKDTRTKLYMPAAQPGVDAVAFAVLMRTNSRFCKSNALIVVDGTIPTSLPASSGTAA